MAKAKIAGQVVFSREEFVILCRDLILVSRSFKEKGIDIGPTCELNEIIAELKNSKHSESTYRQQVID